MVAAAWLRTCPSFGESGPSGSNVSEQYSPFAIPDGFSSSIDGGSRSTVGGVVSIQYCAVAANAWFFDASFALILTRSCIGEPFSCVVFGIEYV